VNARALDTIDRMYDAMNARDVEGLRALGGELADFSWESNPDELDSPGRLERQEVLGYMRDLFQIFDELETEVLERMELGPDQMICLVRHSARGASSGAWVDRREVHLWTARGDRVVSLREFPSVEEAREAAAAT
jgi:ketosteroid isomerase-like protein